MTKSDSNAASEIRWALHVRYVWAEIRSEIESGATAVPEAQQDNGLVAEIANLAHVVTPEGIETLRRGILYELHRHETHHQQPRPKSLPAVGLNKRAVVQLKTSVRLLRELSTILSDLDPGAMAALLYVEWHRRNNFPSGTRDERPRPPPPSWSMSDWSKSIWARQIAELEELSSEGLAYARRRLPPKPRGRPRRGAFSAMFSGSLVEFTLELLLHVRAAGGHLTLDKNARQGAGTLIDVLTLLRPHMTPSLIPKMLPLSTLAKVKALDQKIATIDSPWP